MTRDQYWETLLEKLGDKAGIIMVGQASSQASMQFLHCRIYNETTVAPHYKTSLPSFHSGLRTTLRARRRVPPSPKLVLLHTTPKAERGVLHTTHSRWLVTPKRSMLLCYRVGDGLRTHTRGHAHTDDTPFTMVSRVHVSLRTSIGFRRHHPWSQTLAEC
jgi:hypothetical protein